MTAGGQDIDLAPIIPELTLVGGLLVLLVIDLAVRVRRGIVAAVGSSLLLLVLAVLTLTSRSHAGIYLFGAIVGDGVTDFFRVLFCLAGVISIGMLSFEFPDDGEPHLLVLASILGMFFLAGANDIITLFVAFEMVSIPSYVLAGYRRHDVRSAEASLKYVLFGAVSSGMMLYGFSIIYGLTGSTNLPAIVGVLDAGQVSGAAHMVGLLLILVGIGYKIAMVPFHFWSPDVYEGSPTAVTAWFSVAPKAAGLAALIRLMPLFSTLQPTYGVTAVGLLTMASAVTMTFGNLGAIWQNSLKRLLAYSSIAHVGYLLMGFAVIAAYPDGPLNADATVAVLFYLVVYLFMNLGAFLVVEFVERKVGGDAIEWFRGLGKSNPVPALLLTVFLLSLTGIPPLAGFVGKFYLFGALVKGKLFMLALIGIANTIVSVFYYVRIIRDMFLRDAVNDDVAEAGGAAQMERLGNILAVATLAPTVVLGIFWGPLAEWIIHQVG